MFKQVGQDKRGALFLKNEVDAYVSNEIKAGEHLSRRAKDSSTDLAVATETLDAATNLFDIAVRNTVQGQERVCEAAKKASGNVRKAADDLVSGIAKVQKGIDFGNFERQVSLLERAAAALSVLAELEKQGRLAKIMQAVK